MEVNGGDQQELLQNLASQNDFHIQFHEDGAKNQRWVSLTDNTPSE
jgi:hypothetical protein